MSDFLIMFLLYSCLSSVGCWSIKWRMRLKGGLSLHKQSSRVPGKSSFLTLISLGKYLTKTRCGISRWHISCLLSELEQIPALGWPGRTGVPGHWLRCPGLWLAPIWAMLCPEGPVRARRSAPCPRTSRAPLALARAGCRPGTRSCCWPGHGCSHTEPARSWAGPAPRGHTRPPRGAGRSENLPCYLSMCKITQALQLLQGVCVPWGLLQNCLRNASKDLDCRLLFLRLS